VHVDGEFPQSGQGLGDAVEGPDAEFVTSTQAPYKIRRRGLVNGEASWHPATPGKLVHK
jgi:hypothetical protein